MKTVEFFRAVSAKSYMVRVFRAVSAKSYMVRVMHPLHFRVVSGESTKWGKLNGEYSKLNW